MPPCPDWNEDRPGDLSRIIANINGFWPVVEADTIARPAPSLAIALEWHRRIYDRVAVPRMWASWIVVRYGLPPFVRIGPRPDNAGIRQVSGRILHHTPRWRPRTVEE